MIEPVRFGLLSYPGHNNIGDAIQSLAAKRFLPRIDVHVPRERLSAEPTSVSGPVRLICNGWFMHNVRNWPPHADIKPLLISMHFAETDFRRFQKFRKRPLDCLLEGAGRDYLLARGPVGARDGFTFGELEARGIPAWFSGCLTMTLQRPDDIERAEFIVACDLPAAQLEHLQRIAREPVIVVSHLVPTTLGQKEQDERAMQLLSLYARAKAVVTTRLHAALPCLAFGTPVLLIKQPAYGRRVSDAWALLHTCQTNDFLRDAHNFNFADPPANPDNFRSLVEPMETRCKAFVNAA